jgi:hypothetical protein
MNVILLHSNRRHVSATLVAIFRVMRTRIEIQLYCVKMTPELKIMSEIYRWSLCNRIALINPSALVGLFNKYYVITSAERKKCNETVVIFST